MPNKHFFSSNNMLNQDISHLFNENLEDHVKKRLQTLQTDPSNIPYYKAEVYVKCDLIKEMCKIKITSCMQIFFLPSKLALFSKFVHEF